MVIRALAVPLWFVSIWLTYGLVAYFTGLPDNAGAILGALTAALVFLDPTGSFWSPAGTPGVAIRRSSRGFDGNHSTL